jgi:hypothetical protein
MKALLHLLSLAITLTLSVTASAGYIDPSSSDGAVLFLGQLYCEQQQYCPNFAYWGTTPPGYVELTAADGTPTDYLWVDTQGEMTFEASPLNIPPPAGLPLLGKLVEDGTFQEVDQFFPAGSNRPLYIQDRSGEQMTLGPSTPEPSTLWMFGASGFAFLGRRRLR